MTRWWERRLDAYMRAHDALSIQLRQRTAEVDDLYVFYSGEASNRPLPDDVAEEIRRRWRESERELEDALARGTFLLSEDAVALLRRYQRQQGELERTMQDLVGEQIEAQHEAAQDAMNAFGKLAKRDLRVVPFDLPWRRRTPVEPVQ